MTSICHLSIWDWKKKHPMWKHQIAGMLFPSWLHSSVWPPVWAHILLSFSLSGDELFLAHCPNLWTLPSSLNCCLSPYQFDCLVLIHLFSFFSLICFFFLTPHLWICSILTMSSHLVWSALSTWVLFWFFNLYLNFLFYFFLLFICAYNV
jgi:hypothetical protein